MRQFGDAFCRLQPILDRWRNQYCKKNYLCYNAIKEVGKTTMKFQLTISPTQEESVHVTVKKHNDFCAEIEKLCLAYNGADNIPVYADDEVQLLSFENITCLTVADGKTYAVDLQGKRHLVKMRLYEIEQILPTYFVRINKSAIANETQIAKFKASFSGAVDVIFKCGHVDYVSRRCFSEIKRRYQL